LQANASSISFYVYGRASEYLDCVYPSHKTLSVTLWDGSFAGLVTAIPATAPGTNQVQGWLRFPNLAQICLNTFGAAPLRAETTGIFGFEQLWVKGAFDPLGIGSEPLGISLTGVR
jgi:hypothetical protein